MHFGWPLFQIFARTGSVKTLEWRLNFFRSKFRSGFKFNSACFRNRMFDFAGAIFFEADDYAAAKSGVPIGSVAIANVQTGGSFSSIPEMFVHNYKLKFKLYQ